MFTIETLWNYFICGLLPYYFSS